MSKDLYKTLGVDKNSSDEQIKSAFKKMSKIKHPDKCGFNKDNEPEKYKQFESDFADICEAYEILKDKDKREMYDRGGYEACKNGGPQFDPSDLFAQFFGQGMSGMFGSFGQGMGGMGGMGRNNEIRKGKTVVKVLNVSLEDIYNGKTVSVKHNKTVLCSKCNGEGGSSAATCAKCRGTGSFNRVVQMGMGTMQISSGMCDNCSGKGKVTRKEDQCKECVGKCVKTVNKTLDVVIEKGMDESKVIPFISEADEEPGVMAGDVIYKINIENHRLFKKRGNDLILEKKISLNEALCGFCFDIEYFNKQTLNIVSNQGEIIGHKEIKCIKNKGLPIHGSHSYGDLYIIFDVKFPSKTDIKPEEFEVLKKILPNPCNKTADKACLSMTKTNVAF